MYLKNSKKIQLELENAVVSVNTGRSITVTTIKTFPKYRFIFWTLVKTRAERKMTILLWGSWRTSGWSTWEALVPWTQSKDGTNVMMPRQEPEVGDLELGLQTKFPQSFFKNSCLSFTINLSFPLWYCICMCYICYSMLAVYSRDQGFIPKIWLKKNKFWQNVLQLNLFFQFLLLMVLRESEVAS